MQPSHDLGDATFDYGHYRGALDNVRIYDHTLTAPEIDTLYQSGL